MIDIGLFNIGTDTLQHFYRKNRYTANFKIVDLEIFKFLEHCQDTWES